MSDWTGGLFFAEADGVSANVLLKKLREDGALSDADPKALEGLGDGTVGIAIHPPRAGWWAVVDSADGSAGIGAGEWSRPAMIANHLATTAVWVRVFDDSLALAVELARSSAFFRVIAGDRAEVAAWVAERGCPLDAARPADAGQQATLAALRYDVDEYRNGPDAELARRLVDLRDAMRAGDADAARAGFDALEYDVAPLGLAVVRGLDDDASGATFRTLATRALAGPMVPRGEHSARMTFEEEVLRRVAEQTDDDELFERCLDRLDAIEGEAERRSSHSHPAGVARIAAHSFESIPRRAYECYRRIVARTDEPAWYHVNQALGRLLLAVTGPIDLADDGVAELLRRTRARVPDLGESAKHAIRYNLACVLARGGALDDALDELSKCGDPREQNPHPEKDGDLETLFDHPRFEELMQSSGDPSNVRLDDLELSVRAAEALDEAGLETVGDLIAMQDPSELGSAVVRELQLVLEEDHDLEWGPEVEEEPWVPPPERAVERLDVTFTDTDDGARLESRLGGVPSAPRRDVEWPASGNRPMDFVLQLVGVAGGGEIDLGDVHVLQVFADLEGDFYDPSDHAVVLHREPCLATLEPPVGVDVAPARAMSFAPNQDDRVLIDLDWPDEDHPLYEDHQAAHSHAWADKVWGIPTGANLDPDVKDSRGRAMRCLLSLVSYDDWFLWYVFVSEDVTEACMEIVRG